MDRRKGRRGMCSESFNPEHRGLRNKDIGLYYAMKSKERKLRNERSGYKLTPIGKIQLSDSRQQKIKKLLASTDQLMSSTSTSYGHITDSRFKEEFLKLINGSIEEKLQNNHSSDLLRNKTLDDEYKNDMIGKLNDQTYQRMLQSRITLPSYKKRDEILHLIGSNQVIVISGETGCGKTTQVAQFILDDYIMKGKGSVCKIICTQPRRISAISVAERVAEERAEKIGESSVGYQIRLERKLPRSSGSILYCTTGILLKQMESDPFLSEISHLILDEIHERDIFSDFLLTLLKQLIIQRSDLKVILMSATLNSEKFSEYYGNCAQINIPGYTFPVKQYYLEDVLQNVRHEFPSPPKNWRKHLKAEKLKTFLYDKLMGPYIRQIERNRTYPSHVCNELRKNTSEDFNLELIFKLISFICDKMEPGAILVFLPGFSNISKLNSLLESSSKFPKSRYLIIPLHSKLPTVHQRCVFDKPPNGVRKIVLSTNIAETSITINDIIYVIDCGKIKIKNYDVENNIETLLPEWVSLANASQRKGRAGRVQPGICFHLFTRARNMVLEQYQQPEILRSRLENVILMIKILQLGKAETFLNKVMNPPSLESIKNSMEVLHRMNALDAQERLTPLGYHLARLPVSPQMGKMIILGALFSCLDPVLSIAASLDFKDAFQMPMDKKELVLHKKLQMIDGSWNSDHLILCEAIRKYENAKKSGRGGRFCWDHFLSSYILDLLIDMKDQFAQHLNEMSFLSDSNVKNEKWNVNSRNFSLIKAIICAGLYPNVAIIKNIKSSHKKIRTIENENVKIVPSSVNERTNTFSSPLLIYHLKLKSKNIFLHDTTMIHPLSLLFFGDDIKIKSENGSCVIMLSESLKFKCSENTACLVKDLRAKLDDLLEYKVSHPGVVDWMEENSESHLLSAIIELITSEDLGLIEDDDFDDDTDETC